MWRELSASFDEQGDAGARLLDKLNGLGVSHVLGDDVVDFHKLVADAKLPVFGRRAALCDPEHEQRHVVELAPSADAEPEPSTAPAQLHVVQLSLVTSFALSLPKGQHYS